MDDTARQVPNKDVLGFELPTPEEGRAQAKRWLARTFRRNELVWLMGERYDPSTPAWLLDIVRQGAMGRWVRQRYRFDEQAQVLYFLGERALSDAQFRAARREGTIFQVSDLQDQPV